MSSNLSGIKVSELKKPRGLTLWVIEIPKLEYFTLNPNIF